MLLCTSLQAIRGLFLNDIADHVPIFTVISGCEQAFNKNRYFTLCSKTQQNLTKFKSDIEYVNWVELPGYNDPSQAYGNFLQKCTTISYRCFLLRKVKLKGYTLNKPLLTSALLSSILKKECRKQTFS